MTGLITVAAQDGPRRVTLPFGPPADIREWLSPIQPLPLAGAEPFVSVFFVWEGEGDGLELRLSGDGRDWSPWQALARDPHNPDRAVSEPVFAGPGMRYFQVRYRGMAVSDLTGHFYRPGPTPVLPAPQAAALRDDECPQPPVVERRQWCPGGACPEASSPSFTTVTHLIVHHSAGTNVANDWAAVVRSIWDLHVNGNGWADIGYNYLVDPNGVIYTGRGDDVLGAHFCGRNGGTMGVCVLGNFQDRAPTAAAIEALSRILTWKAGERGLDPFGMAFHASSGLDLPRIAGHRDGCPTECPGSMLYPLLPEVRRRVADSLLVCRGLATATPTPAAAGAALRLFPNPAAEVLYLELDSPLAGEVTAEVFGADGRRRLLFKREKNAGAATLSLPLDDLPAGYYWLRAGQKGWTGTRAFVRR